jgi:putative tryptophan/tyrosine transport system substrate-binding protein
MRGSRRLAVALTLGMLVTALAAEAQSAGPVRRIGRLSPLSASTDAPSITGLRDGLRELGWVEGRNIAFESRFADGRLDRLPQLAAELVRLNVDVIVAGSTPGVLAAKASTGTIPIVMVTTGDPVAGGIVPSLARPGGNITGVTTLGQELTAKRLELLKETMPGVSRIAVLTNPPSPYTAMFMSEREAEARTLGLHLSVLEARSPSEIEKAFTTMVTERAGALMVLTDILFITHRRRIVELAAKAHLPATYPEREFVYAGGLMFYGVSLSDMYRRSATYVDRILKGAKPGDLPIEQPSKLELAVNLKTAKALGLAIPQSVLARADEIIR